MTSGTLGYHLGDVSNGVTPGQGDNQVTTADVSLLGAHYGAMGATLVGFEYIDVGPTTDNSTNGRPTTPAWYAISENPCGGGASDSGENRKKAAQAEELGEGGSGSPLSSEGGRWPLPRKQSM